MGYVGQEPEVRVLQSGTVVATFSLATTERFGGKGEKREERTEWHSVVAYAKVAEVVREHVNKGTPLYLEGRLQTRTWKNTKGDSMYKTEIVVSALRLLPDGSRNSAVSPRKVATQSTAGDFDDQMITDDDIPF